MIGLDVEAGTIHETVILYWSAIARYCVGEHQQADALQGVDRNSSF
jgi:hypothetical protein